MARCLRVPGLPPSTVRGRGVIVVRVFGREVFAVGRVRSDGDGDATGAADLTGASYELADYYPGRHEVTLSDRRRHPFGFHPSA